MARRLSETELRSLANRWGRFYDVSPDLVYAVIMIESGGVPTAVGDGGQSLGLMQLHANGARATWRANGHPEPRDWFDPESNVQVGAWFLGKSIPVQLRNVGAADTVRNRIVAYNAGASRVKRPDALLPEVTKHYLRKVREFGVPLGSSAVASWPVASVVTASALLALLKIIKELA